MNRIYVYALEQAKRDFEFMQADQYMTEEEYDNASKLGLMLIKKLQSAYNLLEIFANVDNWDFEKMYGPYGEYYRTMWNGNSNICYECEDILADEDWNIKYDKNHR